MPIPEEAPPPDTAVIVWVCEAIWAVVKVVLPVEPEMFPVSSFTS